MHAYEMHAYEVHAYEIHIYEIHAHEIHAYETLTTPTEESCRKLLKSSVGASKVSNGEI